MEDKEVKNKNGLNEYCIHNIDFEFCECGNETCDGTGCIDYECCDLEMN